MAKKLLIIDDNKEVCTYFESFFAKRGFQITISLTGEEGILSFEKNKPDLVLLDVKLPGINGLEVLKKIRDNDKGVRVVMITFASDEAIRKTAEELGANDYITKPFNRVEIDEVASRMLLKSVS